MSRQYICSGKCVEAVLKGQSLKSYVNNNRLGKVDYALAAETLKYCEVLNQIYDEINLKIEGNNKLDVNIGIFLVMSYELLFGKKKITGGGAVKRKIMGLKEKLEDGLNSLMKQKNLDNVQNLLSNQITQTLTLPKYIRVNEIKLSLNEGYNLVKEVVPGAEIDPLIPSLIILHHKAPSLAQHDLVKMGKLIIQDKASCFPSQILSDAWMKGDIIDACAAPGNKTTHIASEILKNPNYSQEMIYAFDRDPSRFKLLQDRVKQAGASNILPECQDFLELDVCSDKYKNVRSILCDPSCSGSGVIRSVERIIEKKNIDSENARVAGLHAFQVKIVNKAMSFPNVEIIVYSTCSIHKVIKKMLLK